MSVEQHSSIHFDCPRESILAQDKFQLSSNIKSLVIVCIICLVFMFIEVVGGLLSGSLAILSDAAHLLSDITGFIISLVAMFYSKRPATKKLSYGFHRAEVVGAVCSVALIWALTGILLLEAIDRIRNPKEINGKLMFFMASIGLVINLLMALTLHNTNHHAHHHQVNHPNNPNQLFSSCKNLNPGDELHEVCLRQSHHSNLNIKSAFIHIIGDLIQSVGVMIAAAIIWIYPQYLLADPICTFIFSLIVLTTTFKLLLEAIHVLMEGTPSHLDSSLIEVDIKKINGVIEVHDLHIWTLSSDKYTLTSHIVIDSEINNDELSLLSRAKTVLRESQNLICKKYSIHHSTIQIEFKEQSNGHCKSIICR